MLLAYTGLRIGISIHAPLRGRLTARTRDYDTIQISIHAPLRGRPPWPHRRRSAREFQSTPPCGGDDLTGGTYDYYCYFNPRPLAGATTSPRTPVNGTTDFNPRPLAGATLFEYKKAQFNKISIHAPLRGRLILVNPTRKFCIFQSTPPCGGDVPLIPVPAVPVHFNPRPLAGATSATRESDCITLFQSTPPCGGDCQTGQLEFYKRFRLFSRKSVHGSPKPHFPVLVPSVRFPFALTAPWELLGHRSFWLPGAGFCSDTCFPGCRTASCRGLCQ